MKELVLIQGELKAPKSQYNKFGEYYYRNCEDILEALKPLLHNNNCSIVINDDIVLVGDRYYVKATATISNGTESVSSSAFAREPIEKKGMDSSQITGAASSYARKYALNGLFAIDDTRDADSTKNVPERQIEANNAKPVNTSNPICECGKVMQPRKDGKGYYCRHSDGTWGREAKASAQRDKDIMQEVDANLAQYGIDDLPF